MNRNALCDYKIGSVVIEKNRDTFFDKPLQVGHITGFARNCVGELILKVKWDVDTETVIHPAMVELNPVEWPAVWTEKQRYDFFIHNSNAKYDREVKERKKKGFWSRLFD